MTESDVPVQGTAGKAAAIERAAALLKTSLATIGAVPKVLAFVLVASVVSGVALAWFWFLSRDAVWVRWLALPWLGLAALPQLGLWFLTSSLRELFRIPERLLAIKAGIADQGEFVMAVAKRAEGVDRSRMGFLKKVREFYALHGELGQVVATRLILQRFTGPLAVVVGPVSFVLNCLIIAAAAIQAFLILP